MIGGVAACRGLFPVQQGGGQRADVKGQAASRLTARIPHTGAIAAVRPVGWQQHITRGGIARGGIPIEPHVEVDLGTRANAGLAGIGVVA